MSSSVSFLTECASDIYAPYILYTREEWAAFRANTPLTLKKEEVEALRSLNDPINLEEVEAVYLALSRLLSSHVEALRNLFIERQKFLRKKRIKKSPFIIGIAGSVAVGKSTTARILQELLKKWPGAPKVDLVTTDGFLYPNKKLEALNKMRRKGFPDSYDIGALLCFLSQIKSGLAKVKAPVYSHFFYDIMPNESILIEQPDILIFEGLNVLQVNSFKESKKHSLFVSDFFDFSIYIDADPDIIREWYIERFCRLRLTAFKDPTSYFYNYSLLSEKEALQKAHDLWENINLKNLRENIAPTKPRADLILRKGRDHFVEHIALRKL